MTGESGSTDIQEKLSVFTFTRYLVYGIAAAILMTIFFRWNGINGVIGNLIMGCCLTFFCWMAERLWEYLIYPAIGKSHSIMRGSFRFLVWFLAGGMGYTTGLLIAIKNGFILMRDNPVAPHFIAGGISGVLFEVAARVYLQSLAKRNRY